MQAPIQLFSFHSTSKVAAPAPAQLVASSVGPSSHVVTRVQGVIGECGRRGGYLEITNIPAEVKEQLYAAALTRPCCPHPHAAPVRVAHS
jgi:hypothetical protein